MPTAAQPRITAISNQSFPCVRLPPIPACAVHSNKPWLTIRLTRRWQFAGDVDEAGSGYAMVGVMRDFVTVRTNLLKQNSNSKL